MMPYQFQIWEMIYWMLSIEISKLIPLYEYLRYCAVIWVLDIDKSLLVLVPIDSFPLCSSTVTYSKFGNDSYLHLKQSVMILKILRGIQDT